MEAVEVALKLLAMALELDPALRQAIAIVDGSERAPRLAEVMRAGNTARQALREIESR